MKWHGAHISHEAMLKSENPNDPSDAVYRNVAEKVEACKTKFID